MTGEVHPASFRDPSGYLFSRQGALFRQVNVAHRDEYDALMSSGLYAALEADGALVPHREVDEAPHDPTLAYKILQPEALQFVSYPYEWSFSQLRDAALLTLDIQRIALDHGMSLRDASAYNVQFSDGRPTFIDILSFEPVREGEPWIAYGQFCRHFLAPLALMAYRDRRLGQLLRVHIDGVPLDLADALLPMRAHWRASLYLHLHAHARHARRHPGGGRPSDGGRKRFSSRAFHGLVESLSSAVRKLRLRGGPSSWSGYYADADHYSAEALEHKEALVAKVLEEIEPASVWDLGANTGRFGRLAASRGIPTVCFDLDHDSVEANYRRIREEGEHHLLPLVCDLANPSPGLGWANVERASFLERGPADLVLALALVHHLAIGNNVPLGRIAELFGALGSSLLVEFVPKGDPKVDGMLASRDDVFGTYDREGFERAFSRWFSIELREPVRGSERTMYLMRRRSTPSR